MIIQSEIVGLAVCKVKAGMKTRIISGAVLVLIAAAVLILNSFLEPVGIIAVALLCAIAVYEVLNNTKIITQKPFVVLSCLFGLLLPFVLKYFSTKLNLAILIYILALILLSLKLHAKTTPQKFAACAFFPIMLGYAFYSIEAVLNSKSGHGLFLLLLMLNFSSISDCGAYFVGSAIGKHKLAPVLSPKKTVEGVVGGIVSSMAVSALMVLIYNRCNAADISLIKILIITPMFSVLGMVGDIFASFIKRSCDIKDYSNLIPGHGGIMDRFDSILLIAPVFAYGLDYIM